VGGFKVHLKGFANFNVTAENQVGIRRGRQAGVHILNNLSTVSVSLSKFFLNRGFVYA
jgi:hypothetical protein